MGQSDLKSVSDRNDSHKSPSATRSSSLVALSACTAGAGPLILNEDTLTILQEQDNKSRLSNKMYEIH